MKREAEEWLKIANEDLEVARIVVEKGLYRTVCFHSQQAVEKTLKAILTENSVEFRRTHNIIDLLELLKNIGIEVRLTSEEAGFLNAIYRSRYPSDVGLLPHGEPTVDDAKMAVDIGKRIAKEIKRLLSD